MYALEKSRYMNKKRVSKYEEYRNILPLKIANPNRDGIAQKVIISKHKDNEDITGMQCNEIAADGVRNPAA